MASVAEWIDAARPRTLPLAIASILLGSLLAASEDQFDLLVLLLGLLTTLCLQILSNFANDYGDSVTGVDDQERTGPTRTVQKGAISMTGMRSAMLICSLLALTFGVWLVIHGVGTEHVFLTLGFIALGILALTAAVRYTVGKRPYGYVGLGDLFAFLFFGWVGVLGIHFLHTGDWDSSALFPATAFGFMTAGVLNLNNMRDRIQDAKKGKRTLAVRLGENGATVHQFFLLIGGMLLSLTHSLLYYDSPWQFLYLLSFPFFIIDLVNVIHVDDHEKLDPELKRVAIGSLLYACSFGGGLLV